MQREGAEQDDQRGRAGDDSSSDAEDAEFAQAEGASIACRGGGSRLLIPLRVSLEYRKKPMRMRFSRSVRMFAGLSRKMPEKNEDAETGNAQAGDGSEPGIELFGNDVPRRVECDRSQKKHTRSVRGGDDQAEQYRVPGGAARAYEIGGDDGLAVSGF